MTKKQQFENEFWNAEMNTFFPSKWARDKVWKWIALEDKQQKDKIIEMIEGEVEKYRASRDTHLITSAPRLEERLEDLKNKIKEI